MKVDYKKDYKEIYLPKQEPTVIQLKPMKYITIEYEGNPNDESFQPVVAALYSFSWAIKMKSKKREDYYEYVVFPLEGIWDLIDVTVSPTNKDNLKAKMMIRQPDFLDDNLFEEYRKMLLNKEKDINVITRINEAKLEVIDEGLSCQMMHLGSYDTESESFKRMEEYSNENGYKRLSKVHKEIYISDPRKVALEKLKTVLRFEVEKI